MKYVYELRYKKYNDTKCISVVASNINSAIERAKKHIRKNEYGDKEIVHVERGMSIDAIA